MEQKAAVQVIERGGYLPMQQATPEQWSARRKEFNDWVNTQLVEGTDYGKIPGIDKRTLLQPGAEKITQLFGCLPDAIVAYRDMNAETGYLYIEVTVELISLQTGIKVGAGLGSCSTMESKYRWRNAQRLCPACGQATIFHSTPERGGGWYCWAKKGGCGAKFQDGDATIESQVVGKVPNADLADQWNTVIKMAKKRALVDAAKTISGASETFTQDVEDMVGDGEAVVRPAQKATTQPTAANTTQTAPPATTEPPAQVEPQTWVTDKTQVTGFMIAWKAKNLTEDEIHLNLNVTHMADYKGSTGDAAKILQPIADKKASSRKTSDMMPESRKNA